MSFLRSKVILLLFTGLFFNTGISAQENVEFIRQNFKDRAKEFKEAIRSIDEGDLYYEMGGGGYGIALRKYQTAYMLNPDNDMLNYKIGVCYLNSAYKDSSLMYLEKAYRLNPQVMPDVLYMMGRSYHLKKDFTKAVELYERYRAGLMPADLKIKEAIIDKRIQECQQGKKMMEKPVNVDIISVGSAINSPYPDYRPLISADESMMIFTSRRPNTTGGERSPYDMQYFEDIYVSYQTDGKWQPAENIGTTLNTNDHDAAAGISANGQDLFLYQGGINGGDIILCQLFGNEWQRTALLDGVMNTPARESSASFSFDGNTLYFVSNKKEGSFGGGDIYRCRKNADGNWTKPENLGNRINTEYEEASIFIHPDGRTLYFSSQGHTSMGGFDIFRATLDSNGIWGNPVNLGYPINTPDDDVFFVISGSGKHGYYSSFRAEGAGEKDIYMIDFREDTTETYPPGANKGMAKLTLLKGTVKDVVTLLPLGAEIEIVDNQENRVIFTSKCNSKTGKYLVSLPSGRNYGIAAKADGYLFHSENFNIPDTAAFQEVEKNILLYKVEVGSKMVLKNIFFDFDKATLRQESISELERIVKIMSDYPGIRVEISGHTDNKGSLDYNTNLSRNRAQAVVDYLVSKGVSKTRLEYKGYAFNMPLTTNDTEEGRQMNRRVEFKIVGKE
jgi:outer membrane protein OmpA-like peptidoglycan-associated protein/tetratricopeptide (TPR) repeat protein